MIPEIDGSPQDPERSAGERKRPIDVAAPAGGRQSRLRKRRTRPHQHAPPGHAQGADQLLCLIEPAGAAPRPVERDRHRQVGIGQEVGRGAGHADRQWRGQRPEPLVLERVQDAAERALVETGRPAPVHTRRRLAAVGAGGALTRDEPPGPERVAAPDAQWRRQAVNRAPAALAHRTARGPVEQRVAHRARRGDERNQNEVGRVDEHLLEGADRAGQPGGAWGGVSGAAIAIGFALPHSRSNA